MRTSLEVLQYAEEKTGRSVMNAKVYFPKSGPPMIEGLFVARPVSVMDLTWYGLKGELPETRIVPIDRDYHLFPRCSPLTQVSQEELYRENPFANHAFTLQTAREIKHAYWSGERGLREIARETGELLMSVFRVVHGLTYWYVW